MDENFKKQPRTSNLNLIIFQRLKEGARPSQICKELGMRSNALQYYLSSLKLCGFIKKVGYGTWEIIKEYDPRELQKSTRITPDNLEKSLKLFKPDSVRGHAFQFKLKIPRLPGWENREHIFKRKGIKFKPLKLIGGGQGLEFQGRKIWITNKSIIIFEKSSYLADMATKAKKHAIYELIKVIRGLERLLGAKFTIKGDYIFKVSRQHYSLIKNALAQQYNDEGKKLHIYNDSGLWMVIDNSHNLNEIDNLHSKTAVSDNEKIHNFFNDLKELEDYTPQFVVNSLAQNSQQMGTYAKHLKVHVQSIKELGAGIKKLTNLIKELKQSEELRYKQSKLRKRFNYFTRKWEYV